MALLPQQPGHVMTSVRPPSLGRKLCVAIMCPPLISSGWTRLVCGLMTDHYRMGNRHYGAPSHAGMSE